MQKNIYLLGPSKNDNNISMIYYLNKLYTLLKISNKDINIFKIEHQYNKFLIRFKISINIKQHLHKLLFLKIKCDKNDILHITDHAYLNLFFKKRFKVVVTVHDIIPILAWKKILPNLYYPHFPLFFYLSMYSLKYADEIIVVSTITKLDLIKYFNITEKKIHVIHLGIDNLYKPYTIDDKKIARNNFNLNPDHFNILLTGDQIYKNHEFAINVIRKFCERSNKQIQIIKAGKKSTYIEEITKKYNLSYKNIYCSDIKEMSDLYNSVDCLLFPSIYEGFGLPPLEAMACGLPVLFSDIPVFKETIPDYITKISLNNIDLFVTSMIQISENRNFKEKLIKDGLGISSKYKWEKTIEKTINVYNKN